MNLRQQILSLAVALLPSAALAVPFTDVVDIESLEEVETIFKCFPDSESYDSALTGLAASLATHDDFAVGTVGDESEQRFVYVTAPFNVSSPSFFEEDELKYACVTVQNRKFSAEEDAANADADAADAAVVDSNPAGSSEVDSGVPESATPVKLDDNLETSEAVIENPNINFEAFAALDNAETSDSASAPIDVPPLLLNPAFDATPAPLASAPESNTPAIPGTPEAPATSNVAPAAPEAPAVATAATSETPASSVAAPASQKATAPEAPSIPEASSDSATTTAPQTPAAPSAPEITSAEPSSASAQAGGVSSGDAAKVVVDETEDAPETGFYSSDDEDAPEAGFYFPSESDVADADLTRDSNAILIPTSQAS